MNKNRIQRGGAIALAITLLGLLFAAPAALAQVPTYSPNTLSVPNPLLAGVTTNLVAPLFIDASKQDKVAFQMSTAWSTAGEATGQTNLTYTLAPSVDGVWCDTNHTVALVAPNWSAIGITNTTTTNLSANGIKGWFLIRAANGSVGGIGTNKFTYSTKISAP